MTDAVAVGPGCGRRWRRQPRWWRSSPVLLVGGDDDDRSAEPVAEVELAPTDLAVGARADGTVVDAGAGYSIRLDVAGLPPAPEGEYYEGWLHDRRAAATG